MSRVIKLRRDIHKLEEQIGTIILPHFVPEWQQDEYIAWAFQSCLNCLDRNILPIGEKAGCWYDNFIKKVSPSNVPNYIKV